MLDLDCIWLEGPFNMLDHQDATRYSSTTIIKVSSKCDDPLPKVETGTPLGAQTYSITF